MAKGPLGVQLYRSSVKGRRPQPAAMAYGDLAVNYHHEDPALIIKGDDNVLIEFKPGSGVTVSASAPATAKDGDLWWDPISARLFLRYTSGTPPVAAWVDASPAAVPPSLANALTYKGTIDPTVALPSTVKLSIGDTYVASKAGAAHSSFVGLAGTAVGLHELLVWDGVEWDGAGAAASPRTAWQGQMDVTVARPAGYVPTAGDVVEIIKSGTLHPDWVSMPAGVAPGAVLIFNGSSWDQLNTLPASTTLAGVVRLASASDITAGTAGRVVDAAQLLAAGGAPRSATAPASPVAGQLWVDTSSTTGPPVLKVFDGTAWQAAGGGVKSGATAPTPAVAGDLWVDISTPASPVLKVYNGTAWVAVVAAATAAAAGIVQLADAAAITAGTAGRVVDAAQLKAATQDATTAAKGVVQLADAAAITAGTVGRVVDAAQLKANAVHVGETPPANPHQGSEWFRSSTGKLYVFYDDGAGAAQWVVANPQEAVDYSKAVLKTGDTMSGNLTVPSLNGGQLAGFRNVLINGDLKINQRNVTIAAAAVGAYGPDRWKKTGANTMTQIVEDVNYIPNTVYTLSGNGVTTQQLTSPASGHWTLPSIPITATNVQLEMGTVATPFERRSHGLELMLCKRYFQKIAYHGGASRDAAPPYRGYATISSLEQMKSAPTLSITDYLVNYFNGAWVSSGIGTGSVSQCTFGILAGTTATVQIDGLAGAIASGVQTASCALGGTATAEL